MFISRFLLPTLELCGIASILFSGCFRGRSGTSLKILFDLGHLLIYSVEAQNHSNNKHESQRSNGCQYASAISWVIFLVIMLISLVVFGTSKFWVFYGDER